MSTRGMTLDWLEDAIHGRVKARRPLKLRDAEMVAYREAVAASWVEVRGTREHLENAYWLFCKIVDQPFVRVRPRRVYGGVSFDFIATTKTLTERGRDDVGEVFKRALRLGKPDPSQATAMWGGTSGYVSHVPIADLGWVASQVWACITAPGNWERRQP